LAVVVRPWYKLLGAKGNRANGRKVAAGVGSERSHLGGKQGGWNSGLCGSDGWRILIVGEGIARLKTNGALDASFRHPIAPAGAVTSERFYPATVVGSTAPHPAAGAFSQRRFAGGERLTVGEDWKHRTAYSLVSQARPGSGLGQSLSLGIPL